MPDLSALITAMEPAEAIRQLKPLLKDLLPHIDKEERLTFIASLSGNAPDDDKTASIVHL